MRTQTFNFIPLNVALWLRDIRKTPDEYDELFEFRISAKHDSELNSSNDSVYDNVERHGLLKKLSNSEEVACKSANSKTSEVGSWGNEKFTRKVNCATWPLRKYPKAADRRSLQSILEHFLQKEDIKMWFCLKDENTHIIHVNWLSGQLKTTKRVLNLSDIARRRGNLDESQRTGGEEPNEFASMSNLLANYREKYTQECLWTWLSGPVENKICKWSDKKDDSLDDILNTIKNCEIDFEKRMTLVCGQNENLRESFLGNSEFPSFNYQKSFPSSLTASQWSVSCLFHRDFLTGKPPVPPKDKKVKMDQRIRSSKGRRFQKKPHFSKIDFSEAVPHSRAKESDLDIANPTEKKPKDFRDELSPDDLLQTVTDNNVEVADKKRKKPLPFPVYDPEFEYEINELLMMQRVTESSKERRRISTERRAPLILEKSDDCFQGYTKYIPESSISQSCFRVNKDKILNTDLNEFTGWICSRIGDIEGQNKVKQFLESKVKKVKYETETKIPVKIREDIIIDWENDYENLTEPVVLEGKSVVLKRFPSVRMRNNLHLKNEKDFRRWEYKIQETSEAEEFLKEFLYDESHVNAVNKNVDLCDICTVNESRDKSFDSVDETTHASQLTVTFELNRPTMEICNNIDKKILSSKSTQFPSGSKVTCLRENESKSNFYISDKMSESDCICSVSDELNSYSDFESDINEAIADGEIWCSEKLPNESMHSVELSTSDDERANRDFKSENDSLGQPDVKTNDENMSSTRPIPPVCVSEGKLGTIAEIEEKGSSPSLPPEWGKFKKNQKKSASDTDLVKCVKMYNCLGKEWSKSVDFFEDSLTASRFEKIVALEKQSSITSDVCEWMARIRGIAFAEDQLFSEDGEWILSFDSEERAYFFDETSKKSLWALPDYSSEDTKPDFNLSIQRSATESALSGESAAKLRVNRNGSKGRLSTSARSSKAQSMLIEPKFDVASKDGTKTFSMPRDLSKIFGEVVRSGILNKTKISENGKKLRKNWTPAFAVLTESYLFFFKDAKSFQNMKNVIGSNGNHLCLSLQGAVIEKGEKISSRKNVYKINSSENTEILIQSDKIAEAEEWFKEINLVIQNLPSEPNIISGSPMSESTSLSKIGQTKALKVKHKDNGSMEDLNSTPEERQNKIKARLKKFFIRRPTVDSLKKKGIWKDEPVFGCSLEQITKNRNPRVPIFVEKCIECIESKEENMKTDGLYRASGNLSQVQKIRLEVDQNNLSIMKDEEDVHVLTGSLKLFFRELKEPLIPSKQLEPALLATDKHVRKERIKDFQKIVKSLPTPNYDTLKFLLRHLLRVKEYHKFNRMNISNLAIVFGPTLMWPEQESANMALELMQQNVVIECLLKEYEEIFT